MFPFTYGDVVYSSCAEVSLYGGVGCRLVQPQGSGRRRGLGLLQENHLPDRPRGHWWIVDNGLMTNDRRAFLSDCWMKVTARGERKREREVRQRRWGSRLSLAQHLGRDSKTAMPKAR